MKKKNHADSYTIGGMPGIKAVFHFLLLTTNDFSITDCIKLPTFVHISCCDSLRFKSRSRGGANLPNDGEKNFPVIIFFWLTEQNCDGHTAVRDVDLKRYVSYL